MDIFKDKALPLILIFEGSKYTNLPLDKGHGTKYGITQSTYDSYNNILNKKLSSVKDITIQEVQDIYLNQYWIFAKCNLLPEKLSIVMFDTAVNSGIKRAMKFLQQSLSLNVDGSFGTQTEEAIQFINDDYISNLYISYREEFYNNIVKNNPSQSAFLKGWLRRINFLKDYINNIKSIESIKKTW